MAEVAPQASGIATAPAVPAPRPARLDWVDHVKGFAMIFVVLGHALGGLIDAHIVPHPDWFRTLFLTIYVVHMPLFFFLSGLFVLRRVERNKTQFVRGLGVTMIWPYFLWGSVQLIALTAAASYVNDPSSHGIAYRLLNLPLSPPSQFWFLFALFAMHLLSWLIIPRFGAVCMLIVTMLLASLFEQGLVPTLFGQTCKMAPYYALGILLGATPAFMAWLSSVRGLILGVLVALGVLAVTVLVIRVMGRVGPELYSLVSPAIAKEAWGFRSFFAAFTATIAICAAFAVNERHLPGWLKYIGQHSLSIYVLHIMCIAGCRIVLVRLFGVADPGLLLTVLVIVGLVAPLIAYAIADRLRIAKYVALS